MGIEFRGMSTNMRATKSETMTAAIITNKSTVSLEFARTIIVGSTIKCKATATVQDDSTASTILTSHPNGNAQANKMRTRCVDEDTNEGYCSIK